MAKKGGKLQKLKSAVMGSEKTTKKPMMQSEKMMMEAKGMMMKAKDMMMKAKDMKKHHK